MEFNLIDQFLTLQVSQPGTNFWMTNVSEQTGNYIIYNKIIEHHFFWWSFCLKSTTVHMKSIKILDMHDSEKKIFYLF